MAVDPRMLLLAQMAQGGGGAPPDMGGGPPGTLAPPDPSMAGGPPPDAGGGAPPNPLDALQQVLQDLHALIAILPDPAHTRIASQCLTALAGIQKDLMQPAGPGGGGGAAQPPAY
jgi:hypothetical protein